jgi:hypothetical protein
MTTKSAARQPEAAENPRAVPGSNQAPDYAKRVTEEMAANYAALAESTADQLKQAQDLPKAVENPEDSEKLSLAIKAMRDTSTRAEAFRVREKEPFLRGGNAVDQYFKGLMDRLDKGAAILHARVHAYNEKRRLAEEQRRREEFERTTRAARDAADKMAAEQATAREAEAAAARARKAENIEAHEQRAEQHGIAAESARVETLMAAAAADEARIATLQPPAEQVRERFDSGVLNTMAKKPYVEITDVALLDLNALRPYIKEDALLAALKAWGKVTSHRKTMPGAIVELRAETVIR